MRAAWWGASSADRRARGRSERGRGDARCGAGRARLGQRGEVRVWAARERVEAWAQARAAVGRRGREKRRDGQAGEREEMGPQERWVGLGFSREGWAGPSVEFWAGLSSNSFSFLFLFLTTQTI